MTKETYTVLHQRTLPRSPHCLLRTLVVRASSIDEAILEAEKYGRANWEHESTHMEWGKGAPLAPGLIGQATYTMLTNEKHDN